MVEEAVVPTFSKPLEAALSEVLPSNDPLDKPDFDPINYINDNFPDQNALQGNSLDQFLGTMKKRLVLLNEGIAKDVREFSCQRTRTEQSVETARKAMEELFIKVTAIKGKATQSEIMVQEICRDIKSLDYAKRNLTSSINGLRNLHMLISAVEQLERMKDSKQWRDAASLLKAIADLLTLFDQYNDVPKIQALTAQVHRCKSQIRTQIFTDFKSVIPSSHLRDDPDNQQLLADACLVVNVLDTEHKRDLLQWFTDNQMHAYRAVFAPGEEGGTLAQTERRFAWLRRELRTYSENYEKIFLVHWDVPLILSKEFAKITRADLVVILKGQESDGSLDTTVLLKALQLTIEFEKEFDIKFKTRIVEEAAVAGEEASEAGKSKDPPAVEKVAEHKSVMGVVGADRRVGVDKREDRKEDSFVFDKCISACFQPYMGVYVSLERTNIKELIDTLRVEENWLKENQENEDKRLAGSDELFMYIKKSIKRCTRLTTDSTFFKLYKEYCIGLGLYADLLKSRVPLPEVEAKELPHTQLTALCLIANTAEYVVETAPALGESVKKCIDDDLKSQIDMTATQDAFRAVLNQAIAGLANGVAASMNKALQNMVKMPWSTWDAVGDQSVYVVEINRTLKTDLPLVKAMLSLTYYNFFCTQLMSTFIPKYIDSIYKTKRVNEMGAQQLSLDAHMLKTILLSIPNIEKKDAVEEAQEDANKPAKRTGAAQRAFVKYVSKEMGKAEALLKTVISPSDRLISTFRALVPTGSTDELTKIMALRGLKKHEQQSMVDAYNSSVGPTEKITLASKGMNIQSLYVVPSELIHNAVHNVGFKFSSQKTT